MSFFSELKRRNVFKVAAAYAVAVWLLLQIVDLVLENINAPDWVMQVFMLAFAVGLPIVIIAAWALELTPEGIKLEKNVDKSKSISRQTGHQLNRGIIMILSMAIVLLLTERFRDEIFSGSESNETAVESADTVAAAGDSVDQGKSIAVLPFRDMSAAQDQGYFGEGIAEELLNALVKIKGLKVASRTSAFSLANESLDIPAIAARLDVAHILEGSIRTSGNQVRVTAQLIEVSNDVHLWSETYDGSLDDIFKIQDEITSQITDALKVQLGGESLASFSELLTDNAEAYKLYLRGRHLWRQRNSLSLREAIRLFNEAVRLDPAFHQAWSNLAIAYVNLPDYDHLFNLQDGMALGLAAAESALELSPQSSEALIIKAHAHELNCEFISAARLFEKAIALNPADPTAQHWYSIMLGASGHINSALEHIRQARQIDPLISAVISREAEVNQVLGNYARAEELHRSAASLGIDQGSLIPVAMNYLYTGENAKAQDLMEKELANLAPEIASQYELFLDAFNNPGKQIIFENHMGKAEQNNQYQTMDNVELLAILGSDYVFEYQSELECTMVHSAVWSEPFRQQRDTPEFFELMERAGIVEYWREFGWPDDCASLDQSLAECT